MYFFKLGAMKAVQKEKLWINLKSSFIERRSLKYKEKPPFMSQNGLSLANTDG